jgi:hypothetical protein
LEPTMRVIAVMVAALALAGCTSAPGPGAAWLQDRQLIIEAVRGGMAATQTAFVPSPPVCPGPVPEAELEQLVARAPIVLGAYFTSPQLEKEIAIVNRVAARRQGGPACEYGGGVDWVQLSGLEVSGSSADAQAHVRVWSRVAQGLNSKMAEPHNTLDTTFHLIRIGGRWLISRYTWTFAPGSEP